VGPELGFTQPGLTIVCGDSHTSTHGAFGALAFGIGTSEVEHVLATQTLPAARRSNFKIQVDGELRSGITSKDLILYIIGAIKTSGGTGTAIEFAGPAIEKLSMEARMALCNMAIEAGAKTGLVAPDQTTLDYLKWRPGIPNPESDEWRLAARHWLSLRSDNNAVFDKIVRIDGDSVEPMVTWGTSPEQVVPISANIPQRFDDESGAQRALDYMGLSRGTRMQDIEIDVVFIGSCTNSRLEDLRAAAQVAKGRTVSSRVKRALVVPGSGSVRRAAEKEGLHRVFLDAGFQWREAGCSMCCGLNEDALGALERCASTSNRNFENRQGAQGRTHLMSPAMAAAAAVTGRLTDVRDLVQAGPSSAPRDIDFELAMDQDTNNDSAAQVADHHLLGPVSSSTTTLSSSIQLSSPRGIQRVSGIAAPLPRANIDTDAILPVQFCKSIERSGAGLFHAIRHLPDGSKDPSFILHQPTYASAPILVAGANFGCGSSREHAVWALQGAGFACVIAPSFADIFYNNAITNGLLPVRITSESAMTSILGRAERGVTLVVDLVEKQVRDEAEGVVVAEFEMEEYQRQRLLTGSDRITETLQVVESIAAFEVERHQRFPWVDDGARFVKDVRKRARALLSLRKAGVGGVIAGADHEALKW